MGSYNASRKKRVNLDIPINEALRIVAAAEQRDLATASFCIMVILGAISQGGGTLDRLVQVGSKSYAPRRSTTARTSEWKKTQEGTWAWGDWELYKIDIRSGKRRGQDSKYWWRLRHKNSPHIYRPIAHIRDEAIKEATNLISNGYNPLEEPPLVEGDS